MEMRATNTLILKLTALPCFSLRRRVVIAPDDPPPSRLTARVAGAFVYSMNVMAAVSSAVCWLVYVAVWFITANYNKSRAPAQRQRSWYGTGLIPIVIISAAVRLAVPHADWQSVTFYAPWARFLGLAILLAATALTLCARFALGLMWTSGPAVLEGHQLRTGGPYALTRHPIYTGMLGMVLGTMLVAGAGPWIVVFPVTLTLIEFKIRIEERFMTGEFPGEYPRYRKRVPQLMPGLRLITGHWALAD
jgi:protein-S-isoprenylcysteine O-methyltransferase Ste14